MTLYFCLLICLLLLWMVSLKGSGFELLAPSSVNTIMFIFATALAVFSYGKWNTVDLEWDGFAVVLLGTVCFCIGCAVADMFPTKGAILFPTSVSMPDLMKKEHQKKGINSFAFVLIVAIVLLVLYAKIQDIYMRADASGQTFSSFGEMSRWVRNNTGAFSTEGIRIESTTAFVIKQLTKFVPACGYASALFFAIGWYQKRYTVLFGAGAGLFAACVYSLATGGRNAALNYVFAVIISMYLQELAGGKNPKKVTGKYILVGAVIVVVGLPLFYFSTALIGISTQFSLVEYVTFYFGGGIPSLQYKLNQGIEIGATHGKATFYGLFAMAYKVGLVDELQAYANDFINMSAHKSNIYTAFYRYYVDFGFPGVMLLSGLSGGIYTLLYRKARTSKNLIWTGIYLFVGVALFDLSREESLFSRMLVSTMFITMFLLALMIELVMSARQQKLCFAVSQEKPAKIDRDKNSRRICFGGQNNESKKKSHFIAFS